MDGRADQCANPGFFAGGVGPGPTARIQDPYMGRTYVCVFVYTHTQTHTHTHTHTHTYIHETSRQMLVIICVTSKTTLNVVFLYSGVFYYVNTHMYFISKGYNDNYQIMKLFCNTN